MRYDLKNLNPGIWFFFDEDKGDEGGSVCLRICDSDILREIRKQTIKQKVIYKDHQRYEYEDENEDLRNELIWDYCVVDWKGVFDQDDHLVPCNKEMKMLLMGKSVTFATFVTDKLKELNNIESDRQEELEKN